VVEFFGLPETGASSDPPRHGRFAPNPAPVRTGLAVAPAPATLRAYKADWRHYAAWCADKGFAPVPAAPSTVGAYLASLAQSHAPTTIRRRLAAIGKAHRFNDLPWNPGHRDIQEPLCSTSTSLPISSLTLSSPIMPSCCAAA
jgi:hypothetical protein